MTIFRTMFENDGVFYINRTLAEESYKSEEAWKNNSMACTLYQQNVASGRIVEVDY